MLNWVPRRVRFAGATVHSDSPAQRAVSVRLERKGGEQYVGHSANGQSVTDLRRGAEAMLDALSKLAGPGTSLVLRDVAPVLALKQSFVLAIVDARYEMQRATLIGTSPLSADPARDGALAVLNATNRFLGAS